MNLEPRIRSANEENPGVVCCSANDIKHRCPKCQDHAKRSLRSAADYSPPDPYKAQLDAIRARNDAKHPPVTIAPPLEIHYNEHGVPDPYFHDLERLKGAR